MRTLFLRLPVVLNSLTILLTAFLSSCTCRTPDPLGGLERDSALAYVTRMMDSASSLFYESQYVASLQICRECLPQAIYLKDTALMGDLLYCTATNFERLGMMDSTLVYTQRVYELDLVEGNPENLSSDYHMMAAIYQDNEEPDKAWSFIVKAIDQEKRVKDSPKMAVRYGLASEIANSLGKYDEALMYICESYRIDSAAQRHLLMGRRLSQMGDVYYRTHRYDEAESCYLRAKEILGELSELHSLTITCRRLGSVYHDTHRDREAISLLKEALGYGQQIGELRQQHLISDLLAQLYDSIDVDQSLHYMKLSRMLQDSLQVLEKQRALVEFSVRYDAKQKDDRLRDLDDRLLSNVRYMMMLLLVVTLLTAIVAWMVRRNHSVKRQLTLATEDLACQKRLFLALKSKEQQMEEKCQPTSTEDSQFMERINALIIEQMEQADLSVESIACRLNVTPYQLRQRLKASTDVPAAIYIQTIRLDFACQLLRDEPQMSVAEIALRCGFNEPGNFTRAFKNKMGVSPLQYRKGKTE